MNYPEYITTPPPTPNIPDRKPVPIPTSMSRSAHRDVNFSFPLSSRWHVDGSNSVLFFISLDESRHIFHAINNINIANNINKIVSGVFPANQMPMGAPAIPARANRTPVPSSTYPTRIRCARPINAVAPTAAKEIPKASRGEIDRP